ncbi:MAG: RND transporter [Hyphomicrobiales bacterium]|nr:HlyD family efflux transporter periplasmic adaptor subunit [Hyphomicrobiales bacterium]PCJ92258.1 MAG: RND transporter [Hyphomicrobiales bacterium]
MHVWTRWLTMGAVALALFGGAYVALRENPVLVDLAMVVSGPMQVTIDEEGIARVRDVYSVTSPIAGQLDRTTLEEGDVVVADETIVASIHPLDPPFLDDRAIAQLTAAKEAAKAAVALAQVERQRSLMAVELATSDYSRKASLARNNIVSDSELEQVGNALKLRQAELQASEANILLREAQLASARAQLIQPGEEAIDSNAVQCCIHLTAPVDGVILRVLARSEQTVTPTTPIAEVGDPSKLEIVVDLLSEDAVRIRPGGIVRISGWGGGRDGDGEFQAVVRRVEPAAFTKISSLGIEEQRVNIVLDIDRAPDALGHGYRLLAHLVVWSKDDALTVPIAALFRSGGDWAVFAVDGGRVELRQIKLGQMNATQAQVLSGLSVNDQVVLYPNDVLEDGGLIEPRQ